MAGEWLKLREELFTHPRFLSLVAALTDHGAAGLTEYLFGVTAVTDRHATVTEHRDALVLRVTPDVIADVVMQTLLRVWACVNTHCKVDGDDAVMHPMRPIDLDRVAKVKGFAAALLQVGWLAQDGQNQLRFPNFCEYNSPACLRPRPAKSAAQRSYEYRQRKKAEAQFQPPQPVTERVTARHAAVTPVTEEKRREEKRREEEKTPHTPQGGVGVAGPVRQELIPLPEEAPPATAAEEAEAKERREALRRHAERFDRFWAAYPKKDAKKDAVRAWGKLLGRCEADPGLADRIIKDVCVRSRGSDWTREGGKFIPHPATYLNGERWTDEPASLPDPAPANKTEQATRAAVPGAERHQAFKEHLRCTVKQKVAAAEQRLSTPGTTGRSGTPTSSPSPSPATARQ